MSSLFETSQKGFQALEDSTVSSTDEEFQAKVKTLHSNFCKVAHITSSLALFSPNETLEDITTPSLKYLLTEYYLGMLELKFVDNNRLEHLKNAQNYFLQFISTCKDLSIVHPKDCETPLDGNDTRSAAEKREQKIESYKREKAWKERLKQLKNEASEEDVRETTLIILGLAARKSIDEVIQNKQELNLLSQMQNASFQAQPSSDLPVNSKPAPLKTFVIDNRRQQIRENVFQPSWIQPTLTPYEAADIEIRKGLIQTWETSQQEELRKEESVDQELEDADDEDAIKKAREWDAFCDDNPTGWGNSMANIG